MDFRFKEEKTLIDELKKGNKQAYNYLFKYYYKPLCIYCKSLTKDYSQAEDIVQNVIVKIWENRKKLKIRTSVKNYLYTSVYHNFVNEYAKNKREESVLEQVRIRVLNTFIEKDDAVIKEKLNLIDKAIDDLPEKNKKVFILNKKEGYSYEEIAEILNISKNTVENHISNALSRIRKQLVTDANIKTHSKECK